MSIGVLFSQGSNTIMVRVDGNNCLFRTEEFGSVFVPIDGLKLSQTGVIKEFPDLAKNVDWRMEAIKRFKAKIKTMETENDAVEYVINDLKKFGFKPLYKQRTGSRPTKINE